MPHRHTVTAADPFELPDWLGEQAVTWTAITSLGSSHLVTGGLCPEGSPEGSSLDCDVLAGDLAYPLPVLSESWRHDAHQAWALGQVLLVQYDERLTLVIPGSRVRVEPTLEAVRRLAKAVGAPSERFTVSIRL